MRLLKPLALALSMTASIAVADEAPKPTADFSGTMVMTGKGQTFSMKMAYSVELDTMRTDISAQGMKMAAIRNMGDGTMIMWSNQMPNMAMRMNKTIATDLTAEKTGETREINGITCAVWKVKQAIACLTDDNIPLETAADGVTARMEDLKIGPQDQALFAPPSGVSVMDMPTQMPGMPDMSRGLPF